jgi:hypothetical protein
MKGSERKNLNHGFSGNFWILSRSSPGNDAIIQINRENK